MNYLIQSLRSAAALIVLAMMIVIFLLDTLPIFHEHLGILLNLKDPIHLGYYVVYSVPFLLFFPLLISRYVFGESLNDVGLRLPDRKLMNLLYTLASLILLLAASYKLTEFKAMQNAYSLKQLSVLQFLFIIVIDMPPYYLAEEFFFRGFLFLRLRKQIGWHSYWVTELIFTFAHLGKPLPELAFSFPAGIVLNFLALRTKSVFPSMMVHYCIGILIAAMVTYYY